MSAGSHHSHDHHHGQITHSHHDRHGPHGHVPANFSRAFALGIALNTLYIIVEVIYGLMAGSVALLADAGHNLSDVLGLAVAWAGAELAKRPPSKQFPYGWGGASIWAALLNAVFWLVACGAVAWEAVSPIGSPAPVASTTVIIVASIGIVINFGTAMLFMRGQKEDANIRGAFLHMMADAGVSAGVVVAGIIIYFTGLYWIDPLSSLVIVGIIFLSHLGLVFETVPIVMFWFPRKNGNEDVIDSLSEF